jgi:hypothetical protein
MPRGINNSMRIIGELDFFAKLLPCHIFLGDICLKSQLVMRTSFSLAWNGWKIVTSEDLDHYHFLSLLPLFDFLCSPSSHYSRHNFSFFPSGSNLTMRCNGPILQKDINLFPTYCTTHSKIVQKLILYEITDYKRKNIF